MSERVAGEPVVVVRTGAANLASVVAALGRAGAEARVTDDPAEVEQAARVVLPGVGAFGFAMERLRRSGLDGVVSRRVREGRPLLAICLGMQVLCEGSEESPGVAGLGVVPGRIGRFSAPARVPQLGWNAVRPTARDGILGPGYAYFANSYRLADLPAGWTAAVSEHGGMFVAALRRGDVVACQFHPELSGGYGLALIRAWLALPAAEGARGDTC